MYVSVLGSIFPVTLAKFGMTKKKDELSKYTFNLLSAFITSMKAKKARISSFTPQNRGHNLLGSLIGRQKAGIIMIGKSKDMKAATRSRIDNKGMFKLFDGKLSKVGIICNNDHKDQSAFLKWGKLGGERFSTYKRRGRTDKNHQSQKVNNVALQPRKLMVAFVHAKNQPFPKLF